MSNLEALRAGILAAKAGKRMLARIQFEQATEIDSLCPHSWLWLAWASESPTEAIEYVEKALAVAPDHPFAQTYLDVLRGLCAYSVDTAQSSTTDAFHRAAFLMPAPACELMEEPCLSTRQDDRASSLPLPETDEDQHDSDVEETELDLDELESALEDQQENDPEDEPEDLAAIHVRDELFCDSELDSELESCTFASQNEPLAYQDRLEECDLEDQDQDELVESELVADELLDEQFLDEQLLDDQLLDEELTDEELLQAELDEEESLMSEALDLECEAEDFQEELDAAVDAVEVSEMVDGSSEADVEEAIVLENRSSAGMEGMEGMEMAPQDALDGSVDEDQILLDARAIQSDVQAATDVVLEATPVMLDQSSSTEAATTLVRTVLAVDDSPTVLRLVAMTLEAAGYEVVTAPNGVEAMKLLANLTPALVLLDVNMPRMDGYKLCKLLKSHDKTRYIPVVMLSGKDGLFDKLRGKLVGCDDYLSKPFESVELLRHVARYVPLPDPVVS